ncbi:MAG: FecR domain-containing protein [Balneola sp.]
METKDLLPENDPDLLLAKLLGSSLSTGENISSVQDPLIQKIISYRDKEKKEIDSLKNSISEIWVNVDEETKPSKNATVTSLSSDRTINVRIWATAATVLIAAFIGIFWFTNLSQPKLIAQSNTKIEVVMLADGSEISLRPNSSFFELSVTENKRAYKLDGEAFFIVSKDRDRPFSVEANNGIVTVLGTQFNVSTWGNENIVYLEEGSIRLDDQNRNSVILSPGDKALISESSISTVSNEDGAQYKDWLDNSIVLKSTPVFEVIEELQHHFKIEIDISDLQNKSELITGSIPLTNLRSTLDDLGLILGGTFREVNPDSFVFIPLN